MLYRDKATGISMSSGIDTDSVLIRSLGHFKVCCSNQEVLSFEDFTYIQQKLIAFLLIAPDKRINTEELQAQLWPDFSPRKSRTNLNTCISRIRSVISRGRQGINPNNYLCVKRGVLQLLNCTTDIELFTQNIFRAIEFAESGKADMALKSLRLGLYHWNGEFLNGIFMTDHIVRYFENTLLPMYRSCTVMLCNLVSEHYEPSELDIKILQQSVRFNTGNPDFIKKLYQIHIQSGNVTKAAETICEYKIAISQEGISKTEQNSLLEEIWII